MPSAVPSYVKLSIRVVSLCLLCLRILSILPNVSGNDSSWHRRCHRHEVTKDGWRPGRPGVSCSGCTLKQLNGGDNGDKADFSEVTYDLRSLDRGLKNVFPTRRTR